MNHLQILFVIVVFALTNLVAESVAQDVEPAQVLILSMDGKEHLLEANQENQIPGAFNNATFKIVPAGYRVFRYCGMVFRYPENLEFSSDHDGNEETWTISGDDADLDVLSISGDPSTYLQSSIEMIIPETEFPKQKSIIKMGTIRLNDVALNTYEYEIKWDGETSSYTWAVELPQRFGKSRLLSFGREYDNDKLSEECVAFEKMVLGSLKFGS